MTKLTGSLDGYTALLVKSEGGQAEEVVDEENGILISAMLRQYFMSLRTVGQWKNLADHWKGVGSCGEIPLSPTSPNKRASDEGQKADAPTRNLLERIDSGEASKQWTDFLQSRVGLNKAPINDDSDSEDSEDDDPDAVDEDDMDFEVLLMKKFFARWVGKAGVRATVCDPVHVHAMTVDWTRTIAPVLEGRIKMVGA